MKRAGKHITEQMITDYLAGKLSNEERHAIEKAALTDQYLADRLEGEQTLRFDKIDREQSIQQIKERLSQDKQRGKVIVSNWMLYTGVAAAILLVGYFGLNWLNNTISDETKPLTDNVPVIEKSSSEEEVREEVPLPRVNEESDKAEQVAEVISKKDASPLKATGSQSRQPGIIADAEEDEHVTLDEIVVTGYGGEVDKPMASVTPPETQIRSNHRSGITLIGRVIDSDSLALPGSNVTISGTREGTVTDINGHFMLELPDSLTEIEISFIGYKDLKIPANKAGNVIILEEDQSALSEVVILSHDYGKGTDDQVAEPVKGWQSFRSARRVKNDCGQGKVVIYFKISSIGVLTNPEVKKGINPECDKLAMGILKEFSSWTPKTKDGIAVESYNRAVFRFE